MNLKRFIAPALVAALFATAAPGGAQTFKVEKWQIGGTGGHDYITAEPGDTHVFVSRGTSVLIVDGMNGKVVDSIPYTLRVHGIAVAPRESHGFTSNAGDSTVTWFELGSHRIINTIKIDAGGLDGITYDETAHQVILTNHSNPGTVVALNAQTGEFSGTFVLDDRAPEGAVADGKGRLYVNLEGKNVVQVLDAGLVKGIAQWPVAPCDGPTGIEYDHKGARLFVGCSKNSIVFDVKTGKIVATIPNGDGVDGIAFDQEQKLLYIPAGRSGNVTVVKQETPDKYTVVATVQTMPGTKTITIDPKTHRVYTVALERGPAPAAPANAQPGARPPQAPVIGAYFFAITH